MPDPRDPLSGPMDMIGDRGLLIRLPLPARVLDAAGAAQHLGITARRLGLLRAVGTGPQRERDGRYRIAALDAYRDGLYAGAGIGATERARHRREAHGPMAPPLPVMARGERISHGRARTQAEPDGRSFMELVTGRDLFRHGIFLVLKAMALFGLIMLCLSATPLLKTHFG